MMSNSSSTAVPKGASQGLVREPSAELLAELDRADRRLQTASAEQIISWAVERFFPRLTMATAFGPEGCVILSMLARIEPRVSVFNLDTGYQFQETLDVRDRIAKTYGIDVELKRPELTVAEYESVWSGPLYERNPDRCCLDRKVKVLREAIVGADAWMSGIRRDQSSHRSAAPTVGWDKKFGLVKINPLVRWSKKDVWRRIADQAIPYNPLHDRGYASIGCWPCTQPVPLGEDERAGRWNGTAKTECGLHMPLEQDGSGI